MKPTPTNTTHDRALTSALATERADGVRAAQAEIMQAEQAEVGRLELQIAEVRKAARADEQCAVERAEQTRRERAALIAEQVFSADPDALPALIASFRNEPGRQRAVKIRSTWDAHDTRARAELGESMSEHVLGALLICDLLRDPANLNAVAIFAFNYGGGISNAAHEALAVFVGKASTAHDLFASLETAELEITRVATGARRSAPPTPYHRARCEMRRSHVIYRDLARAWEPLDQREAARVQREFETTYDPPPGRDEFLRQRAERRMGEAGA